MADMPNPFAKADFLARPRNIVKPVLVGGSLTSPWVGMPIFLATICLVGCFYGYTREGPNGVYWLVYGVPLSLAVAVPGVAAAVVQLARRRWLEVTDDGFTILYRDRRRAYKDEQITGVSQRTHVRPEGGYWRWIRLDVHTEDGDESVPCSYLVPPGEGDPLFPLVDRVVRGMARRVVERQAEGARVEGGGWHYDRHGLHVHHGPQRGVYTPEELTCVGVHDQLMCVWRGIETEALLRVPDTSLNAHALGQIVWAFIENRPGLNEPIPGQPLGRLLFVRRGRDAGLAWFMVGFCFLLSLLFIPMSFSKAPLAGYLAFSGLIALFGAPAVWLILRASYLRLAFHQFGVTQPGRRRSLLYADVDRMTWYATFILLEPRAGVGGPSIRFSSVGISEDADVIGMRDHLATVIAQRWWEELGRGPVRWTKRMRLMQTGIEYCPAGFLVDGEPVTAPYHVTSYYLLQMHMDLFVTGAARPVV